MSLKPGTLHTHNLDGGTYLLVDAALLMKHPDTGEWLAAVLYRDADPKSPRFGRSYATTESRWLRKFRTRPSTLTGDGGCPRVGKGERVMAGGDPILTPAQMAALLVKQRRQISALQTALRPFASVGFPPDWADDKPAATSLVTVGEFRQARECFREHGDGSVRSLTKWVGKESSARKPDDANGLPGNPS